MKIGVIKLLMDALLTIDILTNRWTERQSGVACLQLRMTPGLGAFSVVGQLLLDWDSKVGQFDMNPAFASGHFIDQDIPCKSINSVSK